MISLVYASPTSELMIMTELLIYPALTVIMILLIYVIVGPRDHLIRYVTHSLDINVDKCASEDCVRCNKYRSIIKKASDRYKSDDTIRAKASNRIHRALDTMSAERKFASSDLQKPNVLFVEDLESRAHWSDQEFFSDVTVLESLTDIITEEFNKAYYEVWPDGWLVNNTPSGEWAVFHLINQGVPMKKNCDVCPRTFEAVNSLMNGMKSNVFANVSFSVVQSGTTISPHYGPTNVRIRCHLGLKVSKCEESYMIVNDKRLQWQHGRCLLFDDSFLHEVHHTESDNSPRAVLLLDLWHPDLNEQERALVDELFTFQRAEMPTVRTIPIPVAPELIN